MENTTGQVEKMSSNPLQKVQAKRQVVYAKMLYQIRLSDHGLEMAQKLDKLCRMKSKRFSTYLVGQEQSSSIIEKEEIFPIFSKQ